MSDENQKKQVSDAENQKKPMSDVEKQIQERLDQDDVEGAKDLIDAHLDLDAVTGGFSLHINSNN